MWDLVLGPGTEPRPPTLRASVCIFPVKWEWGEHEDTDMKDSTSSCSHFTGKIWTEASRCGCRQLTLCFSGWWVLEEDTGQQAESKLRTKVWFYMRKSYTILYQERPFQGGDLFLAESFVLWILYPGSYLREERSSEQRGKQVQRSWGRSMSSGLKGEQDSRCDWSGMMRVWDQRGGGGPDWVALSDL